MNGGDNDDIFDSLHHLESSHVNDGYMEGLEVGERRGLAEGRSIGYGSAKYAHCLHTVLVV